MSDRSAVGGAPDRMQGEAVGPYRVELLREAKRYRKGHFDVAVHLALGEARSATPVLEGLYSRPSPAKRVEEWFDLHFLDEVLFPDGTDVLLSRSGIAPLLFRVLGRALQPGGRIILSYVTDMTRPTRSPVHRITRAALGAARLRVPPASTPLGRLLFEGGCAGVLHDAYAVQGSSRIAGEKNPAAAAAVLEGLEEYLSRRPVEGFEEAEAACRANAGAILAAYGEPNTWTQ